MVKPYCITPPPNGRILGYRLTDLRTKKYTVPTYVPTAVFLAALILKHSFIDLIRGDPSTMETYSSDTLLLRRTLTSKLFGCASPYYTCFSTAVPALY